MGTIRHYRLHARDGDMAAVGCQQRCSHTWRRPQRSSCRVLMAQTKNACAHIALGVVANSRQEPEFSYDPSYIVCPAYMQFWRIILMWDGEGMNWPFYFPLAFCSPNYTHIIFMVTPGKLYPKHRTCTKDKRNILIFHVMICSSNLALHCSKIKYTSILYELFHI